MTVTETAATILGDGCEAAASGDSRGYRAARESLVSLERSLRLDSRRRAPPGLPEAQEARANQRLLQLRSEQLARLEAAHAPLAAPCPPSSFGELSFHQAARLGAFAEDGELYQIFRKMPKGANLHCHLDGSCDARFILHLAATTKDLCIQSDRAVLQQSDLFSAQIYFRVIPGAEEQWSAQEHSRNGEQLTIYAAAYRPQDWVPVSVARHAFPLPDVYDERQRLTPLPHLQPTLAFGAFDHWLHSRISMTPHAGVPERRTSTAAWSHFLTTFRIVEGIIGYEPNFKAFCIEVMLQMGRDGIRYFEARINFWVEMMVSVSGQLDLDHLAWCRIFLEAQAEAKTRLADEGHPFDGARIIYSTVRIIDNAALKRAMDDCIILKEHYPDLIAGFDLVGHEDPGVPLKAYLPELLWFKQHTAHLGLEIPFILHGGETLGYGSDADENLYDALLLGTKRIGHGFSLYRHPILMELCKKQNVAIECCPISNDVLGYTQSIGAHPLPAMIANGVPLAICNDDCTMFGNVGLTPDFYSIFLGVGSMSIRTLYALARTSIEHSQLPSTEQASTLAAFDLQWAQFVRFLAQPTMP